MLVPSKQKYRKVQKGRVASKSKGGTELAFGSVGLKALEMGRVSSKQVEAARVAATRFMKRKGRLWIKIFPSIPVSKKPAEIRMGKGKGALDHFAFRVSPGRILFEADGVDVADAVAALKLAGAKLPIRTKISTRHEVE